MTNILNNFFLSYYYIIMYNKDEDDRIIAMCIKKDVKPKKKGGAVFVDKCGKTHKKKSKCMCKKNGNSK